MASKKHISYHWRLFVSLVSLLWLMAIVIALWNTHQSRRDTSARIQSQIDLINSRIVSAYEHNLDPESFLDFVGEYYLLNPLYDQIRVTVYYNGALLYKVGDMISPTEYERFSREDRGFLNELRSFFEPGGNGYTSSMTSADRRLVVYTHLPSDGDVLSATGTDMTIFAFIFAIAVGATVAGYFMSRRLGRSISQLRDFAVRAGTDTGFAPTQKFSHDEVGEISRQVVRLFNERNSMVLKLKREHNVAMHALEEKARLKRDLTNNINHELKTPVGIIKGYIDTILEHKDMDDDSRRHFLEKVREHIERLVQLMNDLSSITRLEYGSQMINLEPVDLHEVTFRAVSDYETSGMLGGMTFNYDIPTYCRVVGNEGLLTGMLNNLTKNAAAYSKGTEINLILTGQDEQFYHFAFYDNGVGVKETSLPHLFDRFFREDSGRSRKRGGTGLGLPIVMNTVEALGGSISVSNRDGGGLLFRFTLRKAK